MKFLSKKIKIIGIVQGVGYRPFIYKIAKKYKIKGKVFNLTSGVEIFVEGKERNINSFLFKLKNNCPPIALIEKILIKNNFFFGYRHFNIFKSKKNTSGITTISPDVSICKDCLSEIRNFKNKRYEYPFTNCTNCGPRYTIIKDIPYDRSKTSMSKFKMCTSCQNEYNNPLNRRFHAQPNACTKCGPNMFLTNSIGITIKTKNPIDSIYKIIRSGLVVAIKGIGGFHLSVDATNDVAVSLLRKRKKRPDKPFAIMSVNIKNIKKFSKINFYEKKLLLGNEKPIVLVKKNKKSIISKLVAPNSKYFGVMLPYTPIHYILLNKGFDALVMTSGNLNGHTMPVNNEKAISELNKIADYFLMNNRDIITRIDDSVYKHHAGSNRVIRNARGFYPKSIILKKSFPSVLACGSEIKNSICITRNNKAFVSQYIGNLANWSSYNFFWQTTNHMKSVLKVNPEIIVCDMHPNYTITKIFNKNKKFKLIKTQHHHSHIVSCMAENKIKGPVIGLALDGTGYGLDKTIWGGEVLLSDYDSFERVGSIESLPTPGNSMAIKEPWRMGISYLYKTFGYNLFNLNIPILNNINKQSVKIVINMINSKFNSPLSSSIGRFFDAVSSIIGLRQKITFEGQAAMDLENLASVKTNEIYPLKIEKKSGLSEIKYKPIIKGIVSDLKKKISKKKIASKFHNTIISMFSCMCFLIRKKYGIKYVVFSGGVFQNTIILEGLKNILEKNNFKVITHKIVPSNDSGISLGQALIALHVL